MKYKSEKMNREQTPSPTESPSEEFISAARERERENLAERPSRREIKNRSGPGKPRASKKDPTSIYTVMEEVN